MRERHATPTEDRRNSAGGTAFADLRRFVGRTPAPVERCDLCSAALGPEHRHLLEPTGGKLLCACGACSVLFGGQGGTKYKLIPRRVRTLPHFQMSDAEWSALLLPINMAFFVHSTPRGRVMAIYPSPAGPTESLLSLEAWSEIVAQNEALGTLESDVEALLVNRLGAMRGFAVPEYYIVPIDVCYNLVGLIRGQWRGLSGGGEVWSEMSRFFEDLKRRATPSEASHA